MPKGTVIIGRKEAMDSMCQKCKEFRAEDSADCADTLCPLYAHSPYAATELTDAPPWLKIRHGKAVGFAPKKKVGEEEFRAAVQAICNWMYEFASPSELIVKQCADIGVQIMIPKGEIEARVIEDAIVTDVMRISESDLEPAPKPQSLEDLCGEQGW